MKRADLGRNSNQFVVTQHENLRGVNELNVNVQNNCISFSNISRCTNPLHSDLQILKVPNLGRQRFEVVIPKEERPEQDMKIFFYQNITTKLYLLIPKSNSKKNQIHMMTLSK